MDAVTKCSLHKDICHLNADLASTKMTRVVQDVYLYTLFYFDGQATSRLHTNYYYNIVTRHSNMHLNES